MSRLANFTSTPTRSRSNMSTTDATYHSFHDIELYAPATPPKARGEAKDQHPVVYPKENQRPAKDSTPSASPMKRHDSGYESIQPRHSTSSFPGSKRRISNASSTASSQRTAQAGLRTPSRPPSSRGRPTIRRAAKTSPYPVRSATGQVQALYAARAQPFCLSHLGSSSHRQQGSHSGFFHFPVHPTDLESPATAPASSSSRGKAAGPKHQTVEIEPESPAEEHMPPQPTHYWTSDRTRRLEYAAIDAAHRGLKGWVRRHLVPGCFLPKEKEPLAFDDDTGSVRRYRMELDEEGTGEKTEDGKRWKWGRMKSW